MNPFDLSIEFVGMCMFVPEPNGTSPTLLHVLFVAPDQVDMGDGHRHEAHHPRMFFDTAHLAAGSPAPNKDYDSIALNDKFLNLSTVTGTTPLKIDLPHVPNVSTITGRKLPKHMVGLNPQRPLGGRMTLASGIGEESTSRPWLMPFMPKNDSEVAFEVKWIIDAVPAAQLECKLQGLKGRGNQPSIMLYPILYPDSGKLEIRLRVENVPIGEVSPVRLPGNAPRFNTPAAHFSGHYTILHAPQEEHISPVYIGRDGSGGGSGTAFSCMPSQGELL